LDQKGSAFALVQTLAASDLWLELDYQSFTGFVKKTLIQKNQYFIVNSMLK